MSCEMKGRAVWGGVSGRSLGEQSSGGMAVKRKEARRSQRVAERREYGQCREEGLGGRQLMQWTQQS